MPRRLVYLIPFLVGLALALVTGAGFYVDRQHHAQKSRLQVLDKLAAIQGGLENGLSTRLQLMGALKTYVLLNPDLDQHGFASFAKGVFDEISGIRFLELAKNGVISHAYPARDASRILNRDLTKDFPANIKGLADRAKRSHLTQVSAPTRVAEGGDAIVAVTPVYLEKQGAEHTPPYWGAVLMLLDTGTLFREAGLMDPLSGLDIALRKPEEAPEPSLTLFGNKEVFGADPVVMNIAIPGGFWQVGAVPAGGWSDSPNQPYIIYGGILGTLLVTGLLLVTMFLFLSRLKERDKYRYLVQNAKSIILRVDMAGNITFCNEHAEEFFGYAPGELLGKPLVGTLIPMRTAAGEPMKRRLSQLLKNPSGQPFNETMNVRKNGEAAWVAWTHESILNRNGNMVEMLSVGTDITDRKLMEESLRQRERQYRVLSENVTDIIFGLDTDLRYTFVSPSDEVVRGFKRSEVLGWTISDFLTPSSKNNLESGVASLKEQESGRPQSITLDLEFTCADSGTVWLETRVGPLFNDGGDIIGFQGVGRDITDRKLAEALRDDVERIARHDLKTPLGAVIGLPDEIRLMGGLNASQDGMLATIEKAGESMLQLINRSLDLFKMERGTYELKRQTVDVLSVLEEIKAETRSIIREKGISMGIEVHNGSQDRFTTIAEEPLFKSMLSNLILNGLQASPEGGSMTITLRDGDAITIAIRNQGEVPRQLRDIFFEKYATANNGSGTGLGTYSARLIARTHGGEIILDTSTAGETCVIANLPK